MDAAIRAIIDAAAEKRPLPFRLGLLGGTFDPPHVGHVAAALAARDKLGLDAVLFVPAGVPVYKLDQPVTPAADRLEMTRRAVAGQHGFLVSSIEIDRGGKTYTSDTLRQLKGLLPANVELTFIAGSDAALTIPEWHDSQAIADLARVAVVTRAGYPLDASDDRFDQLMRRFDVAVVEEETPDVSSSAIKERLGRACAASVLINDVADYVTSNNLYDATLQVAKSVGEAMTENVQEAYSQDALSKDFYRFIKAEMQSRVPERRFGHIKGVAKTAKALAKVYGVDQRKARLAGMLHDWDKNFDDDGIRARAAEVGLEVDPVVLECMPQTLHGMTASRALRRDYPQIPEDVLQAVDRHTTAAVGMTDLDMVVFIADCLEPGRKFGRCDELRAMIGEVCLEELFFQVQGYWITLIIGRNRTMHPSTVETWNYYALRHAERSRVQREVAGLPPRKMDPCALAR